MARGVPLAYPLLPVRLIPDDLGFYRVPSTWQLDQADPSIRDFIAAQNRLAARDTLHYIDRIKQRTRQLREVTRDGD